MSAKESNIITDSGDAQEGFLGGFGIFWKKKKFFFQVFYSNVLRWFIFPNVIYIFSQYWFA